VRTIRVIGAALLLSIGIAGSVFSQTPPCGWDAQTGKILYDCSGGNVGIGPSSASAQSKVTVSGGVISVLPGGTQGSPNGFAYDGSYTLQLGFDGNAGTGLYAGFIQAAHWGTEWRPLLLNPSAGLNSGQVGIGTTAPPSKLTVAGGVVAVSGGTQAGFNGFSTGETTQVGYDMSAHVGFVQAANFGVAWRPLILNPNPTGEIGSVGIGTAAPAAALDVQDTSRIVGAPTTILRLSTKSGGSGSAIELAAWNDRGAPDPVAKIAGIQTSSASNAETGDLAFYVSSSGTLVQRLTLGSNGTATVYGNLNVSGNITGAAVIGAVYQDVAEWVPASTKMDAGTVVVLNPEHNNEVMPSAEAYDTRVAGIVSANPGVILGKESDSSAKIAMTGRVRVHVDATKHLVRIGDLLVTSDVVGTAMVSEPMEINGRKFHQPGTVIGKALEPLSSGRGDILVLLSLQ
jgi:hypothetical protein